MFSSHQRLEVAPETTIEATRIDETHFEIRVTTMGDDEVDHRVDVETLGIATEEMHQRLLLLETQTRR